MWKKVIPVAAALILAWIGLNLITAKDVEESVAHAPDVATTDVAESAEAESLHLTEIATVDETPEAVPADEESADVAEVVPADEEPVADTAPAEEATDTETAAEATSEEADATEVAEAAEAEDAVETEDATETADAVETEEAAEVSDAVEAEEATEIVETEETTETAEAGVTAASADEESTETTEAAANTSEASVDANGNTIAMRYPTDPVTGATIYDQGMVEVVIEPTVEPEEEEVASEQSVDSTEPAAEEVAAIEPEEVVEPVIVNKVAMRYPTDPVTGATIFDQGMVEVEFESVLEPGEEIAEAAPDQATEATEVSDASEAIEAQEGKEMRYPTDPVTGATIFDQGMVEVEVESDMAVEEEAESSSDEASETAESTEVESNAQMRYPTDPVTGATLYDQGMVEVEVEAVEEEVAVETSESSSEDASETVTSDVTAEEPASDTDVEDSAEPEVATEVAVEVDESDTATETTVEVAAIAERGTFSLGAISRTLGGVFGTTTTVLSSARDEASAQAVLPRLEAASSSLMAVVDQYATLPEYAKGPLGSVIKRGMARLKPLADTALTREGVGPVLMPVMGPMLESMQTMLR